MLPDLAESACMLVAQELFHLLDQRSLSCQRTPGDDEGFACLFRKTFQQVLLDTLGTIVQPLKVSGLPQTREGMLGGLCHLGVEPCLLEGGCSGCD